MAQWCQRQIIIFLLLSLIDTRSIRIVHIIAYSWKLHASCECPQWLVSLNINEQYLNR